MNENMHMVDFNLYDTSVGVLDTPDNKGKPEAASVILDAERAKKDERWKMAVEMEEKVKLLKQSVPKELFDMISYVIASTTPNRVDLTEIPEEQYATYGIVKRENTRYYLKEALIGKGEKYDGVELLPARVIEVYCGVSRIVDGFDNTIDSSIFYNICEFDIIKEQTISRIKKLFMGKNEEKKIFIMKNHNHDRSFNTLTKVMTHLARAYQN